MLVACGTQDEGGGTLAGPAAGADGDAGAAPVAEGALKVRVLDREDGAESEYRLIRADGSLVKLLFERDPRLRGGAEVKVWGTWVDDQTLTVSSWEQPVEPKRLDAPIARTNLHHNVAILAMQEAAIDRDKALAAANGGAGSLQHFMAETTGGVDTFSADVFRRYDIDYSSSDCLYDNSGTIVNKMIEAFRSDGFDPDEYDHIAVIAPRSCGSDWSGAWAYVGGIRDNGTPSFERDSLYKDNAFDPWYLAHEFGHNLGMHHSQSIDCGSRSYSEDAGGCDVEEYGNYNDPMGWGEGVYWGTPHQRFMGWIDAHSVVTAGSSGTFNLRPADDDTCGIRALRIPIPSEPNFYFYLEYRHARGDSSYAGTGRLGQSRDDALLVTRSRDGIGNQSFNQRLELGGSRYEGAQQGQRYDLGNGVAVQVQSIGGPYAVVNVQMPGSGAHRGDDGSAAPALADGSIGLTGCDGNPGGDECPNDPTKTAPGKCGCGVPEGTCGGGDPSMTVDKSRFEVGEPIVVRYANLPGNARDWVGTYVAGASDTEYLQYIYTAGRESGTMSFDALDPGDYEARLFFDDSYDREMRVSFRVVADEVDECPGDPDKTSPGVCGCGTPDTDRDGDGAADCQDGCPDHPSKIEPGECGCGVPEGSCGGNEPSIRMAQSTFIAGEAIVVNYENLPGGRFDWVGTYVAGTSNAAYLQYIYSNGNESGTMRFNPLDPGEYEARLFFDDSYNLEVTVAFRVVPADADECPNDPNKANPGVCGCGTPDVDGDGDGAADCQDGCPGDGNKTEPGECGCGVAEGTCGGDEPSVTMAKPTFSAGEPIVVHYENLPGGRFDWVGTYAAGTPHGQYLQYIYSNGNESGTMRFDALGPGDYEARLFFDDSYNLEASVSFTVVPAADGGGL